MNDELYFLVRGLRTSDVKLNTIYADRDLVEPTGAAIAEKMMSDENVKYLTKMVIDRADPLRNGASIGQFNIVKDKVNQFLLSWKNLGKFEKILGTDDGKPIALKAVSIVAYVDALNLEFVNVFGESILPTSDVTKVTSVVNPNGLYAHHDRILKVNSKPVPFYERALYRRLNDFNLDSGLSETESPFYKMDHNPRLTETERKKTNKTAEVSTHLDRQSMNFRMIPNYQRFNY